MKAILASAAIATLMIVAPAFAQQSTGSPQSGMSDSGAATPAPDSGTPSDQNGAYNQTPNPNGNSNEMASRAPYSTPQAPSDQDSNQSAEENENNAAPSGNAPNGQNSPQATPDNATPSENK